MDFIFRKVKNYLVIIGSLYIIFIFFAVGDFDLSNNFLGGALFFLILLPFYFIKIIGAGDVKFAFPVGLFFGFSFDIVFIFIGVLIISFLHALVFFLLSYRTNFIVGFGQLFNLTDNRLFLLKRCTEMRRTIPFAGYMAVSTIIWMIYTANPHSFLSVWSYS